MSNFQQNLDKDTGDYEVPHVVVASVRLHPVQHIIPCCLKRVRRVSPLKGDKE